MTLSPEERAMRVTDAILDLVMVDGENVSASVLHPAQDIIAKAIREACNEKLEEAAVWFLALGPLHRLFREQVSTKLRELKDPTP